jgi:LysR family transcriptional regulator (chromosome initiation inhibitor)
MLDYKLVEAMARVVQEKGFDRAAKALHLTQSAVSQRVRLLEEQVGRILLVRTTPPRATAAGQWMIKHYRQVKQLEDSLADQTGQASATDYQSLAIGINADSLATWFMDVLAAYLQREKVVLDLRVDDQDETHRMLRDGEVSGCISTRATPAQGCRVHPLGTMVYRLYASPEAAGRWFSGEIGIDALTRAPALIFNRKDRLLHRFLEEQAGCVDDRFPRHYLPSPEGFADVIAAGLAYGMLPDLQARPLVDAGRLVDLMPGRCITTRLYWHCWSVGGGAMERLTRVVIRGARRILPEIP